jgi:hypothetical protein
MEAKKLVDLVDPMVRLDIIWREPLVLKEAMEVACLMGTWVAGLTLDHTCLRSQMNKGNRKRWMISLSRWHNVLRNTMGWIW